MHKSHYPKTKLGSLCVPFCPAAQPRPTHPTSLQLRSCISLAPASCHSPHTTKPCKVSVPSRNSHIASFVQSPCSLWMFSSNINSHGGKYWLATLSDGGDFNRSRRIKPICVARFNYLSSGALLYFLSRLQEVPDYSSLYTEKPMYIRGSFATV